MDSHNTINFHGNEENQSYSFEMPFAINARLHPTQIDALLPRIAFPRERSTFEDKSQSFYGGQDYQNDGQNPMELFDSFDIKRQNSIELQNNPSSKPQPKRNDGRNVSQVLSSKIKTIIGKQSKDIEKYREFPLKDRYINFLKDHSCSNSQLIVFFLLAFLKYENLGEKFKKDIANKLLKYLHEKYKIKESAEVFAGHTFFLGNSNEMEKKKAQIQVFLIDRYLLGSSEQELDFKTISDQCRPLFGGRQHSLIDKPLKKLMILFKSLRLFQKNCPCFGKKMMKQLTESTENQFLIESLGKGESELRPVSLCEEIQQKNIQNESSSSQEPQEGEELRK